VRQDSSVRISPSSSSYNILPGFEKGVPGAIEYYQRGELWVTAVVDLGDADEGGVAILYSGPTLWGYGVVPAEHIERVAVTKCVELAALSRVIVEACCVAGHICEARLVR